MCVHRKTQIIYRRYCQLTGGVSGWYKQGVLICFYFLMLYKVHFVRAN